MRLQFQEKPWDQYVAVGYTIVMASVLLALGVGNLLAILLVLFFPGYVVVAALFPKNTEIDWIQRIALAFGVSIAVVPLLGILLNFTPWGIRFAPTVVTISLFTVVVGSVAHLRRMQLPPDQRLSLTIDLAIPDWKEYTAMDKGLTLALCASIAVAGSSLAYILLAPHPEVTFTEFYILGPSGNASGYPAALNISQPGTVIVVVENHESDNVNYTVRIDLVSVQLVYNRTSGLNETVELNRTIWSWFNTTLGNSQSWNQPYTFRISDTGLWKIEFLLFKNTDLVTPYRELHLFVRVG